MKTRFSRAVRSRFRFEGIFDSTVRFIEETQLLRTDLWKRFVRQFREDADADGGWRGEYWGKMMRGACFVYSCTEDPELYGVLTATVEDMLEAQDGSGRISTCPVGHEFDAWDLWCRKYVLLGMQYFLEICGDKELAGRVVDSMRRQADYIIDRIGYPAEGKKLITRATRNWRGLNSSSILEPVVRLYDLTGEQRYLDFASYIVDCGGTDVENIFRLAYENRLHPWQYPVTKAYEMTSCFEGLLEYYYVCGDEKYRTAVVNFADRILESDFMIIGGCGCTHELFDHSTVRQANTNNGSAMQETCVTVTLMKFFWRLALLTGDVRYADAFETSFYNAYLGAVNTEQVIEPSLLRDHPDWAIEPLPFDSYSPLTAGTRGNGIGGLKVMSDRHYYGCCACIGSAGLGLVPKMALFAADGGVVLNLYLPGEIRTVLPSGNTLTLRVTTDYPAGGKVRIAVEPERAERFGLRLRIPVWSRKTGLSVNGTPAEARPGYVLLERDWSDGDIVELDLDMRTECIRPTPYGSQVLMNKVVWEAHYIVPTYDEEDPDAKNHLAFRRGPVILAQDSRLGYSVDDPVSFRVREDGFVDAVIPEKGIAPYPHMVEAALPLADGGFLHVTDYASAGKLWTQESKMAAWMRVKEG